MVRRRPSPPRFVRQIMVRVAASSQDKFGFCVVCIPNSCWFFQQTARLLEISGNTAQPRKEEGRKPRAEFAYEERGATSMKHQGAPFPSQLTDQWSEDDGSASVGVHVNALPFLDLCDCDRVSSVSREHRAGCLHILSYKRHHLFALV